MQHFRTIFKGINHNTFYNLFAYPGGSLRAGHRANWPEVNETLPGCFRLLFLLSFIRKTKNTWLKNPTDLLHKNLMNPLHISANCNVSKLDKLLFSMIPLISDFICILWSTFVISNNYLSSLYLWWCKTRITAVKQHWKQK